MVIRKPPAFQFYAADYLADEHVQLMTLEEEGVYIRLLAYCWREGSIPADPKALSRLCKGASHEAVLVVSDRFETIPNDGSRLTHPRLNAEREKQEEWSRKNSINGKNSGKARRRNKLHAERSFNDRMNESRTKTNTSSSSSSSNNKNLSPNGLVAADAATPEPACPEVRPEEYANAYNRERGPLPKVSEFTDSRRKKTRVRMTAGLTVDQFREVVVRCRGIPFLCGDNASGWRADYDWLMKNDTNIARVLEGKYEGGSGNGTSSGNRPANERNQRSFDAIRQAADSLGFAGTSADDGGDEGQPSKSGNSAGNSAGLDGRLEENRGAVRRETHGQLAGGAAAGVEILTPARRHQGAV